MVSLTSASAPLRVLLVGTGRMGKALSELCDADPDLEVVGMYGRANASELEDGSAPAADVVIDFSHPALFASTAAYVHATATPLVEATTALPDAAMEELHALADVAPVLYAENFSLGVMVMKRLVAEAARALPGFDIEVVETHHNHKADSPSGTAKLLIRAMDPEGQLSVTCGREGMVGARPSGEIGVHSLRGGEVAGTHEVHFFGAAEEVEVVHRAFSNKVFASGAVAAAKKLVGTKPGYYDFEQFVFGK